MKKYIFIAAAFAALLSCSKSEQPQSETSGTGFQKGQQVTLHVTAGELSTRVSSELNADGEKVDFKWEKDDVIEVIVNGKSAPFTLIGNGGTVSGSFIGTMPASGDKFNVQYPYDGVPRTALANQTYSLYEDLPKGLMLFSKIGCTGDSVVLDPKFAALRLNLWGTDQTISKIVVTNTSSTGATQPSYTLNISGGKELSSDSSKPTPFFIVVPAGETWKFSAEVINEDLTTIPESENIIKGLFTIKAGSNTFSPSSAQTFTAGKVLNMVQAKEVTSPPKVCFSKGNLQATCTSAGSETTAAYSWGFAANQWDYIGKAEGNTKIATQTKDAVVDLFGWVGASSTVLTSDTQKYGISTSTTPSDYGTSPSDKLKADWAAIATLPQISGRKWHTLSEDEWGYLLSSRKVTVGGESKTSYGEGSVNGVNGLIILPDNWDGIVCSGFTYGSSSFSNKFTESTTTKWSDMEKAGCVFLPAAGDRGGWNVGSLGFYWSSSPYGHVIAAYSLNFRSGDVYSGYYGYQRRSGLSVRLVSAAQ